MLHISELQVSDVLSNLKEVHMLVKDIFRSYATGEVGMVPKSYLTIDQTKGNDYRAMPAWSDKYACIKWIADYTSNSGTDLPTVQAVIILNDIKTGEVLAHIDANTITSLRTAAATAIATSHFVPENDKIEKAAFIGCGGQTLQHIYSICTVRPDIKNISLYDVDVDKSYNLVAKAKYDGLNISVAQCLEECIEDSRVITTLTPSQNPYLHADQLPIKCHINAIGADAPGKRELTKSIFTAADVIVADDRVQAIHSGECQHAIKDIKSYRVRELADYVYENIFLTEEDGKDLTVYDSTGLAIEDLALAQYVYEVFKTGT